MLVIRDNAPWHKGEDIQHLIESTGAILLKLSPYSPDLNSIEHAWANLKHAIKSSANSFDDVLDNTTQQIHSMGVSKCD